MGAATPSEKFSDTVSTAALMTPSAVSRSVSRPTMRPTAFLAAGKSSFWSSFQTFRLSNARSRMARACQHQRVCTAKPTAGWSHAASRQMVPVKSSVMRGSPAAKQSPARNSPFCVFGNLARRNFSAHVISFPI